MTEARPESNFFVLHDPHFEDPGEGFFRVPQEHLHLFTGWSVCAQPPLEDPWHCQLPRVSVRVCGAHGFYIQAEIFGFACPACATVH